MMEVQGWIGDQVTGAELRRHGPSVRCAFPVGGTDESRLQSIADVLQQSGGKEVAGDIANRIVALADSTDPDAAQALDLFAGKSAWARGRDAVIQLFRDSLLSSPVSQLRILSSNVSTALWRVGERKVAESISGPHGYD